MDIYPLWYMSHNQVKMTKVYKKHKATRAIDIYTVKKLSYTKMKINYFCKMSI